MKYAMEQARDEILELISRAGGSTELEVKQPPPNVEADLSVPVFRMAQREGSSPESMASDLASKIDLGGSVFSKVWAAGGFLNFTLDQVRFSSMVIGDLQRLGKNYGGSTEGLGRTIVIDYSSPNIAKPFSVGHLRSTILGQALYNVYSFLGYRVIGDNHIGDWGTQFGKLLSAFHRWGDREKVGANPIEELLQLYVRFHDEAEREPSLNDEGRAWFKKLETGDPRALDLWTWFKELSWLEFRRVYDLLEIQFDEVLGESFYNGMLADVVSEAFDCGVATWGVATAQGEDDTPQSEEVHEEEKVALVPLEQYGMESPLIIQKSDGTSLYATRDLATAKYRIQRWQPVEILYVVGSEQSLYFRQMFKVLELLGHQSTKCVHIDFGLVRLPEGRMSTRKGRVIFLEDVLKEAMSRAEALLEDRDMTPEEKREISRIVGIGAVKYADLSQSRTKEVLFDWGRMLNLKGDSAPYLQYAHARIQSMLRNMREPFNPKEIDFALLTTPDEWGLIKILAEFPELVKHAARTYSPHFLASYLFPLARAFNAFYHNVPVLRAETPVLRNSRLLLCQACAQVLQRGLGLLGIGVPDRM
jgi:arginyl-tRNA synthetase